MNILDVIKKKAKKSNARILLPEANVDSRVMRAAERIVDEKICKVVVLGAKKEFSKKLVNSPLCEIIDIDTYPSLNSLANELYNIRKNKGMTISEAEELIKKPGYFAIMLLKNNFVDGVVAGAVWTTAETLRPALQIIKTKPDKTLVTGSSLLFKTNEKPILFGDMAIIQNPTSEQLAEIAVTNAEFMKETLNIDPKVAMLSFSTVGSAKGDMPEKVRSATEIAKKSKFDITGEIQFDAAIDRQVAKRKHISDAVAGRANVYVFPDLNAGNIGTKIAERLGGYMAIGPIMLGLNRPMSDLSRGCTTEEIVNTVCVVCLMKD